jgi:hypothetical protein
VFQWWLPPVRQIPPLIWTMIQTKLSPYLVGWHVSSSPFVLPDAGFD